MICDETSHGILTWALGLLTATHADRRMAGSPYLIRTNGVTSNSWWALFGSDEARIISVHRHFEVSRGIQRNGLVNNPEVAGSNPVPATRQNGPQRTL